MIDYNNLTPATRSDWDLLVKLYAQAFLRWKQDGTTRSTLPIAKVFQAWWTLKGPQDFRNSDSALRFKAEIRAVAERLVLEASGE